MNLKEKIKSWTRRPVGYVTGEWNRLAPRERRLVVGAGGGTVLALFVVTTIFVVTSLQDIAEQNADSREALAAIAKHRDEYLEAKSRMMAQEVRIGTEPPQIAADLEAAAREVGVKIDSTSEQPPAPVGKRYLEHRTDFPMQSVNLQSLARFLNKVETGHRLILITRMKISRMFSDGEKLNVEMTATAFERVKDDKVRKRAVLKEKDRS